MTLVDDRQGASDSASALGVALLGQLVRHLDEAQHIVEFVAGQADLNLIEVSGALVQAANEANQAFQAACILRRGAELDAAWTNNPSRPKAVFARHRAAIAAGAIPVDPAPAPMLIRSTPSPATPDQRPFKPRASSRPQCGHPTKSGGRCAKIVVVLEDGVLASGCEIHLPASERPSYERQRTQTDVWLAAAAEHYETNGARMSLGPWRRQ